MNIKSQQKALNLDKILKPKNSKNEKDNFTRNSWKTKLKEYYQKHNEKKAITRINQKNTLLKITLIYTS